MTLSKKRAAALSKARKLYALAQTVETPGERNVAVIRIATLLDKYRLWNYKLKRAK